MSINSDELKLTALFSQVQNLCIGQGKAFDIELNISGEESIGAFPFPRLTYQFDLRTTGQSYCTHKKFLTVKCLPFSATLRDIIKNKDIEIKKSYYPSPSLPFLIEEEVIEMLYSKLNESVEQQFQKQIVESLRKSSVATPNSPSYKLSCSLNYRFLKEGEPEKSFNGRMESPFYLVANESMF